MPKCVALDSKSGHDSSAALLEVPLPILNKLTEFFRRFSSLDVQKKSGVLKIIRRAKNNERANLLQCRRAREVLHVQTRVECCRSKLEKVSTLIIFLYAGLFLARRTFLHV
ncbi:MAG: hypothetical protein GY820_26940 [Gammaproteobacteria bacterium]|nr:hypothetical protein [Gammaproteobacteria bacterium]